MHVCTYIRTYVRTCVSVQLTAINYNNRDDQSIDPNDTSHDDRDDRLHDEVRPHHSHSGDTHPTLGCAVSCTNCYQGVEGGGGKKKSINRPLPFMHVPLSCASHTLSMHCWPAGYTTATLWKQWNCTVISEFLTLLVAYKPGALVRYWNERFSQTP